MVKGKKIKIKKFFVGDLIGGKAYGYDKRVYVKKC